jgi:hypothetical protein
MGMGESVVFEKSYDYKVFEMGQELFAKRSILLEIGLKS